MDNAFDSLWHDYQKTQFLLTQRLATDFSFAIITAHNPLGTNLTPCQNRLLDKQLLHQIELHRSPYRALVGASADLSHLEKSWAVFIDKSDAVALGCQFNQLAIYYVEKGELSLVPCAAEKPEVLLGDFHRRTKLVYELPDLNA